MAALRPSRSEILVAKEVARIVCSLSAVSTLSCSALSETLAYTPQEVNF